MIKTVVILISILTVWSNVGTSQVTLKYYGVNDIEPDEYSFLKDSLGGNFALVEIHPDTSSLKNVLAEAERNNLELVIWPVGGGHQWTPWAWQDSVWDISEGLDLMHFADNYIATGGDALIAVVMSHEPFYNDGDPFTASEMKMLYADLKNAAPNVQLFVYMNDMAYYDKSAETRIENGIMDIAGIWLHCFGGAEGTWAQALQEIDNDYALVQEKSLNLQLFFAIQTFAIAGTRYKMPSATDMSDFGTKVLEKNKLDGIIWYPWDQASTGYTSYLSKDRYDDTGGDRWAVVTQLSAYQPVSIVEDRDLNFSHSALSQNYPNPFNSTTTIPFSVTGSGILAMKVFNLCGQQVSLVFERELAKGNHEVDFDASGLPPGLYFYSLEQNNAVITKKMMIQ